MSFIRWDNSYNIGIVEIDNQHRSLVELINNLVESVEKGEKNESIDEIIGGLLDYILYHFDDEETLFEEIHYPDSEYHKKEHARFVKKVCRFRDDLLLDRSDLNIEILHFLCEWLKNHIRKDDVKFGLYLKQITPNF